MSKLNKSKNWSSNDIRDELWMWDKKDLSDKEAKEVASSFSKADKEANKLIKKHKEGSFIEKFKIRWKYSPFDNPIDRFIFALIGPYIGKT